MKKAKINQKVVDRWFSFGTSNCYGFGTIKKLTSRSCYIKFSNLKETVRYDKQHFERYVAIFNDNNLMPDGFIKENSKYSLTLK